MSEFHRVSERLSVSPQLQPGDLARAASEGFVRVVCNRPDSESSDQPSGAAMKAAAQAAGLEFVYLPFAGMPSAETADAVFAAAPPLFPLPLHTPPTPSGSGCGRRRQTP